MDNFSGYADGLLHLAARTAMAMFPDGGQGTARRNAWRAMVADAAVARARREAEDALARVTAPAGVTVNA